MNRSKVQTDHFYYFFFLFAFKIIAEIEQPKRNEKEEEIKPIIYVHYFAKVADPIRKLDWISRKQYYELDWIRL